MEAFLLQNIAVQGAVIFITLLALAIVLISVHLFMQYLKHNYVLVLARSAKGRVNYHSDSTPGWVD